jgi:hypothetical protein
MRPASLIARFSLLAILVTVVGALTILFAKVALPALSPSDTLNGRLSGQLNAGGIQTTRAFTISASGIGSGTTYYTSAVVSKLSPTYVFTPVGVGDFNGYTDTGKMPVTWTVSIATPGSCYVVTPPSYTVYLTQSQKVITGLDFTVNYRIVPATVTVILTEVQNFGTIPPTMPVIVPPAISGGTANFTGQLKYSLTGASVVYSDPSGIAVYPLYRNGSFSGLLDTEPVDGSCQRTFTATVASLSPYKGINWHYVPATGSVVTVTSDSPNVIASILPYHYWVFQPIVRKTS